MAEKVGEIYYNCTAETGQAISSLRNVEKQAENTGFELKKLSGIASTLAGAFAIEKIIAYSDAWATLNNRLVNVTKAGEIQALVTERVFQIAQKTRSSLDGTAIAYQRIEQATQKYYKSGYEVGKAVETVNKAMIVSGAATAEAHGAIIQFTQSLGAGYMQAQEFNSVNEQTPRLMQMLVDSTGKTRAELKKLGEQGKLTTEMWLKALEEGAAKIDTEYGKMTATFAQSLQVATNNMTKFIGQSSVISSTVQGAGQAFVVLSEHLDQVMIAMAGVGAYMTTKGVMAAASYTSAILAQLAAQQRKLGSEILSLESAAAIAVSEQKAAAATLAHAEANYAAYASEKALASVVTAKNALATATTNVANAQGALAKATGLAAGAMRGMGAVVTMLGGPAGVITLAVMAIMAFSQSSKDAKVPTEQLGEEVSKLAKKYKELNSVQAEAGIMQAHKDQRRLTDEIKNQQKEIEKLEAVKKSADVGLTSVKNKSADEMFYNKQLTTQRNAVEDVALAKRDLQILQDKLNQSLKDESTLTNRAKASPTVKVSEADFLLKYDKQKKAIDDVNKAEKESIAEIDASKQDESVKELARIAVRADAAKKIAEINKKAAGPEKFDYKSYYANLQESGASAWEKIGLKEEEEEAKAKKLRAEGKIEADELFKALVTIHAQASAQRMALEGENQAKNAENESADVARFKKTMEDKLAAQTNLSKQLAALRAETASVAIKGGALNTGDAEIESIKETNAQKLIEQKKLLDDKLITEQQYADLKLALEQNTAAKTEAIQRDAAVKLRGIIDPVAQMTADYQAKIALVEQYETYMADRGIAIHQEAELAKQSITNQYQKQKQAAQEAFFVSLGVGNEMLINSLNAVGSSASSALTGLITQTTTARDAANALGNALLGSVVGTLVQVGLQYVKNLIIGETASAAAAATAAATGTAMAAAYTPAAVMASLASFGANAAPAMAGMTMTSALGSTLSVVGRKYGGSTDTNSLYQVNETGTPEMWTANNGKQYMMTGSQSGSVTPANKLNSGVTININNNASGAEVSATTSNDGKIIDIAVNKAVSTVASQLANNTGQVWNAARSGTTIQGKTR